MPLFDATATVHGSGSSVQGPLSVTAAGVYGDTFLYAGSAYSNMELDFGAPGSAAAWPYVSQFPSYTEAAYAFPPEVPGAGGVGWGLHILITEAFNTLASVNFQVCASATTNATYNGTGNPISSRVLTLAQMQVVGAHYYIPINPTQVLEFLRFYGALTGSNPTTGKIVAWFGPRTGGEQ